MGYLRYVWSRSGLESDEALLQSGGIYEVVYLDKCSEMNYKVLLLETGNYHSIEEFTHFYDEDGVVMTLDKVYSQGITPSSIGVRISDLLSTIK